MIYIHIQIFNWKRSGSNHFQVKELTFLKTPVQEFFPDLYIESLQFMVVQGIIKVHYTYFLLHVFVYVAFIHIYAVKLARNCAKKSIQVGSNIQRTGNLGVEHDSDVKCHPYIFDNHREKDTVPTSLSIFQFFFCTVIYQVFLIKK